MSSLLARLSRPEGEESLQDGEPRLGTGEVLLLVLAVFVARLLASRAFPIYDDAFITYRYARNLAAGLGLVYNPGAAWEPILGTTTPGYAVFLAGMNVLGLPILASSLALNFLCDALSAWMLIQLFDRRAISSLIAVFAFASIPEIARISAGGMEAPAVVFCSLAALRFFLQDRMVAAGVWTAVACTLRPECALLVFTLSVFALLQKRSLLRYLIPVLLIGLAVAGTLTWIYGSPIAHSISAKAVTHAGEQRPGFSRLPDILAQAFGPSQPMRMLTVLVAIGALTMLLRRSRLLPFGIFACLIVTAYLIARPKTWGWYFYAPMFAWIAWLGLGCEQIVRWIGFDKLRLRWPFVVRASTLAGSCLCLAVVAIFPLLRPNAATSLLSERLLHPDKVTSLVYERFGTWAKEAHIAERKATVLASDIGAIGWYTDALVYDSAGLVWPEALKVTRPVDQIRKFQPDYVILVVRRSRLKPFRVDDPELAAKYVPIRRFNEFNKTGLDKLNPDIADLPDWWEQDYIIYERVRDRQE